MKAVVFHEHGGPEVLRVEEVATPEPGPGEVLLEVRACSLNRGPDTMVRAGGFGLPGFTLPHVCGADPAGEVAALGPGVQDWEPGDRALVYPILWCGECDFCRAGAGENACRAWKLFGVHRWGGQAEYCTVPARNLVRLPAAVDWAEATALPVSYLTTWHGLVTRARVAEGDTLLVMAAGSGVGTAAIQIARHHGARVVAATGAEWKMRRAAELGAELVVNYNDPAWPEQVREFTGGRGVSIAFDNNGGETFAQSVELLDRGGRAFCSGATQSHETTLDLRSLYRRMITLHFHMQGTKRELERLCELVAEGAIRPVVDSTFPLEDSARAQEKLAALGQFGKIVLVADQVRA